MNNQFIHKQLRQLFSTRKTAAFFIFVTAAHFAITVFLYFATTVGAPDFDFVNTYPGLRFVDANSKFVSFIFLVPSILYAYIQNEGKFYAGSIWWITSLFISVLVGLAMSYLVSVFLKVSEGNC